MAEQLTEEQLVGYRLAFKRYDTDGSGELSLDEIKKAIESIGMEISNVEVERLFSEVDTDKSNSIDFAEFLAMMVRKLLSNDNEEEILEAFKVLDKDNSGSLSTEELATVLKSFGEKLSDEEVNELLKIADADGNGTIDYKEFTKLLLMR